MERSRPTEPERSKPEPRRRRATIALATLAASVLALGTRAETDSPQDLAPGLPDSAADTTSVDSLAVVVEQLIEITPDSVQTEATYDTARVGDVHPQDRLLDRGFLIRTGDGRASLRFRGSIRLNGALDLNGLQDQDVFDTFRIPVGAANTSDPRFFMSATQTRIGMEMERETRLGDAFLRIEMDFRGIPDRLRLRHAYGTLDHFLVGQTWTLYSDVSAFPLTVDFEGPNSAVVVRAAQVRYQSELLGMVAAVSAESPTPEVAETDSFSTGFQVTPDVAARVRKAGSVGHVQVSGMFRVFNLKDLEDANQKLPGYGLLLSGALRVGPRIRLLFQIVGGDGISRFINSLSGQGLDVLFNPVTKEFETLAAVGSYASFGLAWSDHLQSYVTAGITQVENKDYQPPDAFNRSVYGSANLFWDLAQLTRFGIEYTYGERRNKDEQVGTANRWSFITYFDF